MSDYTRIGSYYPDKEAISGIGPEARRHTGQKKTYYAVKRMFDILLSLVLLIAVLSWLVPLIALIIRLDSGSAVFFRQKRVGKDGCYFTCYKFRTMIANGEADLRQATKNDPRITRMGKWLRRSNIDELPQLINVLLGQMSIVGPRPHMPADCERFSAIVRDYAARHRVKPGITGLAQVKGYHGPTPDYESIFRRYQWDAFYIRNAGMWMDIRIMISTVVQRVSL
jgi:putative colanic acid biosynthesis UDP-glucose lipid carrier transferase